MQGSPQLGGRHVGGEGQCEIQSYMPFTLLQLGNRAAVESRLHMQLQRSLALVKPTPFTSSILYAVKRHYRADGICKQVTWDITLLGT